MDSGTSCASTQGHVHIEIVFMSLYHIFTLHQQAQEEVCPSTQCLHPD